LPVVIAGALGFTSCQPDAAALRLTGPRGASKEASPSRGPMRSDGPELRPAEAFVLPMLQH